MDIERLMGRPTSCQIISKISENANTTTLQFEIPDLDRDLLPGEFMMIWIPGVDEVPMSVSYWDSPTAGVTVKRVGEATHRLAELKREDWIGIRGPFGNHFSSDCTDALVVGGGIGVAPLRLLAYTLLREGRNVTLVVGARTQSDLILYDFDTIGNSHFSLVVSTDDGSRGEKGYASGIAGKLVRNGKFDKIYTCGPEIMMAKLHQVAIENEIEIEASLERYMKCGCGICGTCAIDPNGELVCVDGPVFSGKQLEKMNDFGHSYRSSTGQKSVY
ncbi:MAG: dihydroorotate dehydrogenase electron transfer subunit [Candidatus Thorarchaeota archaeon]